MPRIRTPKTRGMMIKRRGMAPTKVANDVVKIYFGGASPEQAEKIRGFCQAQGWHCQPTKGWGRKRGDLPVNFILNTYEATKSIRGTARATGINPGHVHRVLRQAGEI